MKEHEHEAHEAHETPKQPSEKQARTPGDELLEGHIARLLQEQASHIQFTATLRNRVMQRLTPHASMQKNTRHLPALSVAIVSLVLLISVMSVLSTLPIFHPSSVSHAIQFTVDKTYRTPDQLTHNGQLVSLDPTGHTLIYGVATQPGVMYTTNLSNPVSTNILAMKDAREATWLPDGSALVATIDAGGAHNPQLALVPTGKYMYLLGHEALTAGWSPIAKEITYVTFEQGLTHIWATSSTGQNAHMIATLPISSLVQHIVWSPNGQQLALLATAAQQSSPQFLNASSRAIYIMNSTTKAVYELVKPGNEILSSLSWSPNGRLLTYVGQNMQSGQTTLYTFNMSKSQLLFTVRLHSALQGFSWSPDSRVLLYSDGGALQSYVVYGQALQLPTVTTATTMTYPLWLNINHILFIETVHSIGQLTQLRTP